MADLAIRVDDLERWRDGNGKPGAAAIIADHEKRITREETRNDCQDIKLADFATAEAVAKATERQVIIEAVGAAMAARGKSREGRVRAWGPYFAAACALIAALAPYIFRSTP